VSDANMKGASKRAYPAIENLAEELDPVAYGGG
jgi:hypothetical protein